MKLVDILAREMNEWPEGFHDLGQAVDGSLHLPGVGDHVRHTNECYTRAKDWMDDIVTRSEWEAARAKLSKPNGGKDGFICHRGGKCPVEALTLVDVRHRDGEIIIGAAACGFRWNHIGSPGDNMAYRIHTPSEQPATVKESLSVEAEMPAAKYFDGPLQWRDRITEIDAESKDEAERHNAVMTALDTERAELVQKLAGEGLALISAEGKK